MVCLSFEMEQNATQSRVVLLVPYHQMYNFRTWYDTGITGITYKNVKYTGNKWEVNKQHSGEYEMKNTWLNPSVHGCVRCIW